MSTLTKIAHSSNVQFKPLSAHSLKLHVDLKIN